MEGTVCIQPVTETVMVIDPDSLTPFPMTFWLHMTAGEQGAGLHSSELLGGQVWR